MCQALGDKNEQKSLGVTLREVLDSCLKLHFQETLLLLEGEGVKNEGFQFYQFRLN